MNNDLIFPIIPREGKVPVVADKRVKKVNKQKTSNSLNEEEKAEHQEERKVSDKEQYIRHQTPNQHAQDTENPERSDKPDDDAEHHLDLYI